MRLELTGRQVDITPALRRLVDSKLARLDRMLNDSALSAQVVLSQEKYGNRADVTLHARGEKFLHGVGKGGNWQASMGEAVEKIVQQAQKVKGKWQARKRRGSARAEATAVDVSPTGPSQPASRDAAATTTRVRMPPILRASRRQAIKAMSIAEAARQVDGSEGVVIFRDTETSGIAVLYRTASGELTLVETEA